MTPTETGLGAAIDRRGGIAWLIFEFADLGGMKIELRMKRGANVPLKKLEESAQIAARDGIPSMGIRPGQLTPITWAKWQEEEYE